MYVPAQISAALGVLEWTMVTVASLFWSSSAAGRPTMLERPTTTARLPAMGTPLRSSSSMQPCITTEQGTEQEHIRYTYSHCLVVMRTDLRTARALAAHVLDMASACCIPCSVMSWWQDALSSVNRRGKVSCVPWVCRTRTLGCVRAWLGSQCFLDGNRPHPCLC